MRVIPLRFEHDDGGRAAAGYRGATGDCVVRAIAIATRQPYAEVYAALNLLATRERPRRGQTRSNARTGVAKVTYHRYLAAHGWTWTPTMGIGTGCRVHMRADELPATGELLILALSRHLVACRIYEAQYSGGRESERYGVYYDTGPDVDRNGTRCVYGYWRRA